MPENVGKRTREFPWVDNSRAGCLGLGGLWAFRHRTCCHAMQVDGRIYLTTSAGRNSSSEGGLSGVGTRYLRRAGRLRTSLAGLALAATVCAIGVSVPERSPGAGGSSQSQPVTSVLDGFHETGNSSSGGASGDKNSTLGHGGGPLSAPYHIGKSRSLEPNLRSLEPRVSVGSSLPGVHTAKPATSAKPVTSAKPAQKPQPPQEAGASGSRGSMIVGSTSYPIPSGAIFVSPSGSDGASGSQAAPLRTLAEALRRAPAGATVVLRGGVYHESVVVKRPMTIQSYPGEAVWFDGSVPVSGWVKTGAVWEHSGWDAAFDSSASFSIGVDYPNFVTSDNPMAAHPDLLFVDGKQLRQVATASAVRSGTFAVDYATHTLIIGDNPVGHDVRASDLEQAILANVTVKLRGFGVRRYASPTWRIGAIRLGADNSQIQNVVFDNNATVGISFGGYNTTLDHLTVTGNGLLGILANHADGAVIENTIVLGNNTEHFNPQVAAGGIKVTRTRGITINNVNASENAATGIWLDESTVNFKITNNTVRNNAEAGIETELSDTGIIANNVVTGSRSSGIYVFDTGNVKIFNNALASNGTQHIQLSQDQRRQANASDPGHDPRRPVPDPTVPWLLRNITVANNVFDSGAAFDIWVLDKRTGIPADSMNVSIVGNIFTVGPVFLAWGGSDGKLAKQLTSTAALQGINNSWKNLQVDSMGSFETGAPVVVASPSIAVPLPSDVAAAIGQQTGTKNIGPFS